MFKNIFVLTIVAITVCLTSVIAKSPSVPDAYVYIISPVEGEIVTSPVLVKFGLRGMGVAPAGTEIKDTGHHHLLIDVRTLPDTSKPIPADENHVHFGKGQTEALIELSPGTHSLQLLFADFVHIPHDPIILSKPIIIHVAE